MLFTDFSTGSNQGKKWTPDLKNPQKFRISSRWWYRLYERHKDFNTQFNLCFLCTISSLNKN